MILSEIRQVITVRGFSLDQFVDQLFIMALWAVDLEMVPAGDIISYAMEDETYRPEGLLF